MIDETLTRIDVGPEAPAAPREGRPARSFWVESWERMRGNRPGMTAGGLILALAVIALAAPLLSAFVTHYDPARQDLANNFDFPGRIHWLGSDELGRDTLTRLMYGAQISLGVGFLTVEIGRAHV